MVRLYLILSTTTIEERKSVVNLSSQCAIFRRKGSRTQMVRSFKCGGDFTRGIPFVLDIKIMI